MPDTVSNTVDRPLDILLVGASGLVGQGVLQACLASPRVGRIVSLVRSPSPSPAADARLQECVLPDFSHAGMRTAAFEGLDACFYCAGAPPLGTPEAEYRRVTVDLTLAVARAFANANPSARFLYVSGAYADPHSDLMPLRVKGQAEQALAGLPLVTTMLRPGGVRPVAGTGTRHRLLKPLYAVGRPVMKLAERAVPRWTTSNLAIGQAMIALAGHPAPPALVECGQINRLARG